MIRAKSLTWRNLLLYGNKPTTYEFSKGISRVAGENGVGKSAIVEALWFALFGKPYRKIKLDQLINSVNKRELEVTFEFEIHDREYRIERGLKPHFFRIFEDGELIPLDSKKKTYQQLLEEEILHFNENIADQILVKSLTRNISFLTQSKGEKRKIVEGIFDIEIFSVMNKICKARMDAIDAEINDVRKEINFTDQMIERERSNLNQLRNVQRQLAEEAKRRTEESEEQVKELQDEIEKFKVGLSKIEGYRGKRKSSVARRDEINDGIKGLQSNITNLTTKVKFAEGKLKLFTETCPGCVKLAEIKEAGGADKYREAIAADEATIEKMNVELRAVKDEIKKYDEILANESFLKNSIQKNQRMIDDIVKRAEQTAAETIVVDESKLIEYKQKRQDLEEQYNALSTRKNHFNVIKMLLSDDGIKTFIIKRHLPSINKLLNTYLQKFHTDILFYFDSEFNEVIGTRYKEDFNYYSFSEGQKRRIDLAIMFSFSEFSKLKNRKSNTNLMLLDEITAGCDAVAENALYDILREIVNKESKEVLTVSHSMAIDTDKIDRVFHVTVDKGFSNMARVEA